MIIKFWLSIAISVLAIFGFALVLFFLFKKVFKKKDDELSVLGFLIGLFLFNV